MAESVFPRKIMLATDGSKNSLDAAKKTAQIAKTTNSDVIIIHVTETSFIHMRDQQIDYIAFGARSEIETENEEKKHLNEVMAETKKAFDDLSVRTTTRFLNRQPTESIAKIIIDEAVKEKADLLVVGATGNTGLTEWLLGSVSEKVIRHAPCPVLVIR